MTTTTCIMIAIAASLCLVSSMKIGDNQSSMNIGDTQSSMEIGDTQSSMNIGDTQSSMEIGDTQSSMEIGDTQVEFMSENVFFMKMLEEYNNAKDVRSENVFFMKLLEEYDNAEDVRLSLKSCQCTGYGCSCCVNMRIMGKDENVCVRVSFNPSDLSLDITLTLNGNVILHTHISAKNPPPICVGIPMFPKLASICLRLYDIQIQNRRLHACIAIEVKIVGKVIQLKLGCFNIPPGQKHSVTGEWSDLKAIDDAGIF